MSDYFIKYLEYIQNTGGSISGSQFREDWEPIGLSLIDQMLENDLIEVKSEIISLSSKGHELLKSR